MSKPKILFVSFAFYPEMGGIEVNSQILSKEFYELGYPIKLVTMVSQEGDMVFPFPVIRNPKIKELFKLHSWADVVFENNPSLRLSWPHFFMSSKSVIAIRARISREDGTMVFQDKLKLKTLEKADGVIAVSSSLRDNFYHKATVIGNPYREQLFTNLGLDRDPLTFAFLGRLVSEKGLHIAFEAIKQLKENLKEGSPRILFRIIGDGPEKENLQNMALEKGLKDQVVFEGRQEGSTLNNTLNKCRYLLVPSRNEGFGNVVLEGMACGCLPIASDCSGLVDAVGNAGVLFKTYSPEALRDAILNLLNNPMLETEYRAKIGKHLANFKPRRVAQKYLEIIEKAYQKK